MFDEDALPVVYLCFPWANGFVCIISWVPCLFVVNYEVQSGNPSEKVHDLNVTPRELYGRSPTEWQTSGLLVNEEKSHFPWCKWLLPSAEHGGTRVDVGGVYVFMCCCSHINCSNGLSFQSSLLFSPGEIIVAAELAEVWQLWTQQYILTSTKWAQQYSCFNSLVTNVMCCKNPRKEPEPK